MLLKVFSLSFSFLFFFLAWLLEGGPEIRLGGKVTRLSRARQANGEAKGKIYRVR